MNMQKDKALVLKVPENDITGTETNFAVLDTETNWHDKVMSIGIVVANAEMFQIVAVRYYVITPEDLVGGMYSGAMQLKNDEKTIRCSRAEAFRDLSDWLRKFGVSLLFAYNACFDRNHLPELSAFTWHDIMRLAAYRQYNLKIPQNAECWGTGRLKRNYGVEPILRMLMGDNGYCETHNALYDALDELKIMQLLGHKLEKYDHAVIK